MKTSEDAGVLKEHCMRAEELPAAEWASAAQQTPTPSRELHRRLQ
jgi:hypothetical protein